MKLFSFLSGNEASARPQSPIPGAEPQERPFDQYLALAVRRSRALTPRGQATVEDYLRQHGRVPGQPLDEGRRRAKELADAALDIRAAELLRAPLAPRRTLSTYAGELYRDATLQKARHDAVLQMRQFCGGMMLALVGTGDECAWCRANDGKHFAVSEDPNEVLARNCTCAPYSTAMFHPVMQAVRA